MRRKALRPIAATGALLAIVVAYLLLWPVPIEPRAWQAPPDPGHVDPLGDDERLRRVTLLDLGTHTGPEDAAFGPDGFLYLSTAGGDILRLRPGMASPERFAEAGGRPLGIEFDGSGRLLVANAELGLQRIEPDGTVQALVSSIDGQALGYANDVAVAASGRIYLSVSTTRFDPADHGGTYRASVRDLTEHGTTGHVLEIADDGTVVRRVADGLSFANGVAVSADQRWLLVAETGAYRIWRFRLDPEAPVGEIVIDALPDFPDNLNNGLQGRIWVGLIAPRNALLDRLAGRPFLRKVIERLPQALRPSAVAHSHVIAINVNGDVLMNLHDSGARLPALTGVIETRDELYLTTLFGSALGRLSKRDLATP